MIVIGIDNGVSGGVAILSGTTGKTNAGLLVDAFPMPLCVTGEISAGMLYAQVSPYHRDGETVVVVEECPAHSERASIMRSMAFSYGVIVAAMSRLVWQRRIIRVRSGNPKDSWQRAMLGRVAKGETKLAAAALAKRLWPEETFLASNRSKVPHSGMVDAALIAEFYRRQSLSQQEADA